MEAWVHPLSLPPPPPPHHPWDRVDFTPRSNLHIEVGIRCEIPTLDRIGGGGLVGGGLEGGLGSGENSGKRVVTLNDFSAPRGPAHLHIGAVGGPQPER